LYIWFLSSQLNNYQYQIPGRNWWQKWIS